MVYEHLAHPRFIRHLGCSDPPHPDRASNSTHKCSYPVLLHQRLQLPLQDDLEALHVAQLDPRRQILGSHTHAATGRKVPWLTRLRKVIERSGCLRGPWVRCGGAGAKLGGGLSGDAADVDVASGGEVMGVSSSCLHGVPGKASTACEEAVISIVGAVVVPVEAFLAHQMDASTTATVGVWGGTVGVVIHIVT